MASTREVIQSALKQQLTDDDGKIVEPTLFPGLSEAEMDDYPRTSPIAPPPDVLNLLQFCTGIAGLTQEIDFTGRLFRDGFELELGTNLFLLSRRAYSTTQQPRQ